MSNNVNNLVKNIGKMKINEPSHKSSSNSVNNLAHMFSKVKIRPTKRVAKTRERIGIKGQTMKNSKLKAKTRTTKASNKEVNNLIKLYVPEENLKKIRNTISKKSLKNIKRFIHKKTLKRK